MAAHSKAIPSADSPHASDTPEAVIVIDGAGTIVRFDDCAIRTFGYSADEVLGKNVRLLMPEPYQSAHDHYLSEYLRTGVPHIIGLGRNVKATRKDGSDFPAHLSVVEIELGGTRGFVGILRDISAHVAAEAENMARRAALDVASKSVSELRSQHADVEARYRLLADNAVDVIAHHRGTQIVWISPSVETAFGDPPEHWIGKDFTLRIHPDDQESVGVALQDVARGNSAAVRCRVLTATDGYRWVEARGKPYLDAGGNADGMIFAIRVIDDQVAAEQQLAADRERFEAVVGNTPSAISVLDVQFRYTLVNDAFCQLFGQRSVKEVIGRSEQEILPPEALQRSRRGTVRLLLGESYVEEESIALGREVISVMTQRFPLHDSAGAITGLVAIRTDITHRKRMEQEAAESATWEERIRAAIGDGRLLVYSQPIVDIATREATEEELLVRLRDVGTGEILPPSEFLPPCEKYGLMPVIDHYMVGRAIELAHAGRRVCVNITGQTIADPSAMTAILEALRSAGPDTAAKILFEITETTALASPAVAKSFSLAMSDLGCRVALDDFGTGYGTFNELRNLDLDSLKIDLSFVRNLLEDGGDERAVSTILLVARIYGLTTVAEGVENEATLEKLAGMGADRAQGYLFGRPEPVAWR